MTESKLRREIEEVLSGVNYLIAADHVAEKLGRNTPPVAAELRMMVKDGSVNRHKEVLIGGGRRWIYERNASCSA